MQRLSYIATGIVLALSSSAVFAADLPTNPNILQGVQQLQTSVQQLQVNDAQTAATLQGIQATLAEMQKAIAALTPAAPGNVLITPFLSGEGRGTQQQGFVCASTNLATTNRILIVELLDIDGKVLHSINGEIVVPGLTFRVGVNTPLGTTGSAGVRCRVTVTNGTKQEVTASLTSVVSTSDFLNLISSDTIHAQ